MPPASGDAAHLAQRPGPIGDEVDDERGDDDVEAAVGKGQRLCIAHAEIDAPCHRLAARVVNLRA